MFHIPKEVVLVSRMIPSNSAQPEISRGDVEDHYGGRDHRTDSYPSSSTEIEENSSEENNALLTRNSTQTNSSHGNIVTVDVVNHSVDNKTKTSIQHVKESDLIKEGSYLSGSNPTCNCDPSVTSICAEECKDIHQVRNRIVLNQRSGKGCHINHGNVCQTKETCDKSTDTEGLSSIYLDLNLSYVVVDVCGKDS